MTALFYRRNWKLAYAVMLAGMAADIDHLLANPVYDPQRCGIGFHPLHTFPVIALYVVLGFMPKSRYLGIGLVIHMALDSLDCKLNNGVWYV